MIWLFLVIRVRSNPTIPGWEELEFTESYLTYYAFLGASNYKSKIADSETMIWKLTNSGFFTTAFAKTSLQPLYSKKDWAPFVWHGKHIPKHAMALWIALFQRPTPKKKHESR